MSIYFRFLWTLAVLLLFAVASVYGEESDVAIVQANGSAWLNGTLIPGMSAIFPGDLVETKTEAAGIEPAGSLVIVVKESVVRYEGAGAVEVKRGGVSVNTSRKLFAHLGNVKIQPSSVGWVKFEVAAMGDTARIVAIQGDVSVSDEQSTAVLQAGHEVTVPLQKKRRKYAAGAVPPAQCSILYSTPAMIVGGSVIGGITAWVLLQREDPISPDKP